MRLVFGSKNDTAKVKEDGAQSHLRLVFFAAVFLTAFLGLGLALTGFLAAVFLTTLLGFGLALTGFLAAGFLTAGFAGWYTDTQGKSVHYKLGMVGIRYM
ncbi:MAG: hypothetical protein WAN58_12770 [Anaerolineales bacterium]